MFKYMNNDYIINKNNAQNEYWREYGNWGGVTNMVQGFLAGSTAGVQGGLIGALMGGASHVGKLLQEGFNGGATLKNQLTEQSYELAKRKITVPELSTQPMTGLDSVFGEGLTCEMIGPTANDLRRFDNYFDRYGYAMAGTVFNKAYLSGREYCNYIQASDVHIISDDNNFGLATVQEAERQLNNGVRIWHTKPQDFTHNYIVV